jgi:hypothetical protein
MLFKLYKSPYLLVFVNFLLTTFFLIFIVNQPVKQKSFGDDTFHLEAKSIAEFIKGHGNFENLQITKAPGPSIIYSFPYSLVSENSDDSKFWLAALIWNLIMVFVLTSILLVTISVHISRFVSWLMLLFLFAIPLHLYYNLGVLAEPLAFMGICIFLIGSILIIKTEKFKIRNVLLISLGLLFFLTARPNGVLVFLFFPLFCFILFHFYKVPFVKIRDFILGFLFALFGIILISFAVKSLPGNQEKDLQDNYLFFVMHHGRFQFQSEYFDWRFWDSDTRPDSKDYQNWIKSTDELRYKADKEGRTLKDIYKEWLINDTVENWDNMVIQSIVRFFSGNYLQVSSTKVDNHSFLGILLAIINLCNILINIFAILGFIKFFKENRQSLFIIAPVVALLFFHMLIYMEQRYLYPYRLIIIFFAAIYCADYLSKLEYVKKIKAKWHL